MNLIREQYSRLDEEKQVAISPAHLASRVYDVLDPTGAVPLDIHLLTLLQLKQMARNICDERDQENQPAATQEGLFEVQLQERPPAERADEKDYVLRQMLALGERRAIVRLRAEAAAKERHAQALEAETESGECGEPGGPGRRRPDGGL